MEISYNNLVGSQKTFGKNIKKARNKIGLTQKQVADKAKIHVNYYARAERGEETLSMKTLKTICKILKVKSSDILDF